MQADAVGGEDLAAGAVDDAAGEAPGFEIDLEDGGIVLQAADGAFEDALALAEDGDAVAHELDLG